MSDLSHNLSSHIGKLLYMHDVQNERKNHLKLISEDKKVTSSRVSTHSLDYFADSSPFSIIKNEISKSDCDLGNTFTYELKGKTLIINPETLYLQFLIKDFSDGANETYKKSGIFRAIQYIEIYLNNVLLQRMTEMELISLYYTLATPGTKDIIQKMTMCGESVANLLAFSNSDKYLLLPIFIGSHSTIPLDIKSNGSLHENAEHDLRLFESVLRIKVKLINSGDFYTISAGALVPHISKIDLLFDSYDLTAFTLNEIGYSKNNIRKFTFIESIIKKEFSLGSTSMTIDLNEFSHNCFALLITCHNKATYDSGDLLSLVSSETFTKLEIIKSGNTFYQLFDAVYLQNLKCKLKVLKRDTVLTHTIFIPFSNHFEKCFSDLVSGFLNMDTKNMFLKINCTALAADSYINVVSFSHAFLTFSDGGKPLVRK